MKIKYVVMALALPAIVIVVLVLRRGNSHDRDVIPLSGNVEVTEVNVGFKIAGRVTGLYTDEGRSVRQGDKIAVLDRVEYESQVAQSRAAVRNAAASLEKAEQDLARAQALSAEGAMAKQQLDSAKTSFDAAAAQRDQAAAARRTAESRLRDTLLFAPVNGVVLRKNVEAGETVAPGTPILTIGDLDNPWVKVYVKEDKLGLVKLGQRAEVRTDTYPQKTYAGEVTFISSEAEFTPRNVQTQEERVKLVFGVKVSVKNENHELKPGMPADVRILIK